MSNRSEGPFGIRSSAREFLLNRAEPGGQEQLFGDIPVSALEELSTVFQELVWADDFLDAALDKLEDVASFGVLAIRMDELPRGDKADGGDRLVDAFPWTDILEQIDAASQKWNGTWGLISVDQYGLYLPHLDEPACIDVGKSLQAAMRNKKAVTATIGVAAYPTLDFPKQQVLHNAVKAVDHAAFFGPGSLVAFDSVSLNISGDKRYQADDMDGAIAEYLRALELAPSNVNVHNSLGVCYGILGSYDKAMASFQTAARIDPDEVMPVYNTGLVYVLKERPDKALDYFQKAKQMGPDIYEIALQIGKCHLDNMRYHRAVSHLEEAARLKPEAGPPWRYLGECYAATDKTDLAIQAYEAAIKKNPNDAAALSGLGHIYDVQDRNTEIATLFCQQSVDLSPENGLYSYRLGRLLHKQNRLEEAMGAFQSAAEKGHNAETEIEEIQNRLEDAGANG